MLACQWSSLGTVQDCGNSTDTLIIQNHSGRRVGKGDQGLGIIEMTVQADNPIWSGQRGGTYILGYMAKMKTHEEGRTVGGW